MTAVARDYSNNTAISSQVAVLARNPLVIDIVSPNISSVLSVPSINTATKTWITDEPATSIVEYGLDSNYGFLSPLNSSFKNNHSVQLTSLNNNTTYHYRVISSDISGNTAFSPDFTFSTLSPQTLPTGLFLAYPFDENSGTIADDFAGTADGTVNGAAWVAGKYGNALSFDGINDHVNAGSSSAFDNMPRFTAAAWIYPYTEGENGKGNIISKSIGGEGQGWIFGFAEGRVNALEVGIALSLAGGG